MSPADDPAPQALNSTGEMAIPRRVIRQLTSAQRGALAAMLGTAVILVAIAAARARLGFGLLGDIAIALVGFVGLALAYGTMLAVLQRVSRVLLTTPRAFIFGTLFAGTATLGALAGIGVMRPIAAAVLFTAGWWGATIASFIARDRSGPGRRPFLLLALSTVLTAVVLQAALAPLARPAAPLPETPARSLIAPGGGPVSTIRYGSGADARRDSRYGADAQARTAPVNLAAALPGHRGLGALVHRRYWDLRLDAAPVNATVWMPPGSGPVPVALLLHGVGVDERSEDGLAYLGAQLASHGIAAVGIDANFLSGPWLREADGGVAARELLVLAHLNALDSLDRAPGSPLAGRVDRSRIALIGHSRGGEAMAAVAMHRGRNPGSALPSLLVDSALAVRAVVALSPTEGLFQPYGRDIALEDVSYLLLRGSQDADVPPEAGAGQYTRVRWTAPSPHFKAAVVLPAANHAQFNAHWGRRDRLPPLGWLLRDDAVMDGSLQRELTAATVLAFLEEVLTLRPGASARFDHRVDELASRTGLSIRRRIASARTVLLETFENDADPFRGDRPGVDISGDGFSVWREWRRSRTGNTMLQLVWPARPEGASYVLTTRTDRPAPTVARGAHLVFAAASLVGHQTLRVEVETRDGRRTATDLRIALDPEFAKLSPRWRSPLLEGRLVPGALPALHTYAVPLDALADGAIVHRVRFIVPAGSAGAVMLDDIGLRPPGR